MLKKSVIGTAKVESKQQWQVYNPAALPLLAASSHHHQNGVVNTGTIKLITASQVLTSRRSSRRVDLSTTQRLQASPYHSAMSTPELSDSEVYRTCCAVLCFRRFASTIFGHQPLSAMQQKLYCQSSSWFACQRRLCSTAAVQSVCVISFVGMS